jgi:hypothetical protein
MIHPRTYLSRSHSSRKTRKSSPAPNIVLVLSLVVGYPFPLPFREGGQGGRPRQQAASSGTQVLPINPLSGKIVQKVVCVSRAPLIH